MAEFPRLIRPITFLPIHRVTFNHLRGTSKGRSEKSFLRGLAIKLKARGELKLNSDDV
jgi:hypothetical protein